jgi:hypothetical protein
MIPGEIGSEAKKTPLLQLTSNRVMSIKTANSGSRKHVVFVGPLLFARPLQQRAGLKGLLRQFTPPAARG